MSHSALGDLAIILALVAVGCGGDGQVWLTMRLDPGAAPGARRGLVGDTVAVVDLEAGGTLVSRAVPEEDLAELRQATGEEVPAVTVRLQLPSRLPEGIGNDLDVVLFLDRDGDGQLGPDEPWVSSWDGGRGSYRLEFEAAGEGWSLREGGSPAIRHDPASVVVTLDPYSRAVTGSARSPATGE